MGVSERKEREKEELKRKIVRAATDLFRELDYAAVSMRKIAQRIEYSVGTLYLYFKDKDELFLAVQEGAFARAFGYIQQLPETDDPMERLGGLGERYLRFGMENPDLYRLMFMMEHPMQALKESDSWRSGIQLHNLLTSIVTECINAGKIRNNDPDRLSFALWSFVHGMVALRITHRLDIYDDEHLPNCPLCKEDLEELVLETHNMMMALLASPES